MKLTITTTPDQKYLSDVLPELPIGILNKTQCNVGGSHLALNYPDNYLIVVPTKDLIDNKLSNPSNSKYELFGIYAGITNKEFRAYIKRNTINHILVTYDSLPKLIRWLGDLKIDAYEYRVLFDEYHMLLTEMGYRQKAIEGLVKEAKNFKHYTFMSATPIPERFLPQELAELPYTEIKWTNTKNIIPTRFCCPNVYRTTVRLLAELKQGLEGVEVAERFVFTNTVIGIKQILDSADLDPAEVKVVCANTIRNHQLLGNYKISTMTGENKKYNFFTSKGFQGCDLFSKSGLCIVVSDAKKKHTLTDIQTTLYQISGRIRDVDNIFADRIFHIYSTGYVTQTREEYEAEKKEIIDSTNDFLANMNNLKEKNRIGLSKNMNIDTYFISFDETTNLFEYSELKEKFADFNFELTQHTYTNGLSIRKAYEDNGIAAGEQIQTYLADRDTQLVKRVTKIGFKILLEQYIELREKNSRDDEELTSRYELEHPLFKEAYEKLGKKVINSCKFNEVTIKERLFSISSVSTNAVKDMLKQKFNSGDLVPVKDVKAELQNIYNILRIKSKAKATEIKNYLPSDIITKNASKVVRFN